MGPQDMIIVSISGALFKPWFQTAQSDIGEDKLPRFRGRSEALGSKFYLEDGQHRLAALEKYIGALAQTNAGKGKQIDKEWVEGNLWWNAAVYDTGTRPAAQV